MLDRLQQGDVPRKHHVALRGPGGELRHEECITRDGFDGAYSIVYHSRRPHTARQVDGPHLVAPEASAPRALRRRHYLGGQVQASGTTARTAATALLFNRDVVLSIVRPTASCAGYFANGDGDDLYFIHQGGGTLRSQFGDLPFQVGDYVCVPRGVIHRFVLDPGDGPQLWFGMECTGGVGLLKQWRNDLGQLRMDAPYCHRDFRRPTFVGPVDEQLRRLDVKRSGQLTGFEYDDSPLDVVGWDGTVYPWAFPIEAFQPRVSSVHLPPTWHGTFATRGALVCSFVPRLVDWAPDAIPCPYPHSSVDCDEAIFYVRGNFTSRKGVGPASISYHPAGIAHGPHPGSYEGSIGAGRTDEMAVMLDTFLPLAPTAAALGIEDADYHDSFR